MTLTCGKVCPVSLCYKWSIHNFTVNSVEHKVKSPLFSTTCLNLKYTWQLYLFPNGKRVEDKDYLSIFLYNRSNTIFIASICFSILNQKNEFVTSSEIQEHKIATNRGWGLHKFVNISTIMKDVLANNDTLVIHCEIIFNDENNDEERRTKELQARIEALRLQEFDLQEKLMQDGKFSDVTFILEDCRSNPLKLHKCILAKSSPVFAAMFESNPEKHTIEIKDVKYDVFVEVAWFAYIGKIADIGTGMIEIEELLAAANKYEMDGLKLLCEMAICERLSVINVFEYLRFAEVNGMEELKTKAIEFIASNGEDTFDKPEFQALPTDVLRRICYSLKCNKNID